MGEAASQLDMDVLNELKDVMGEEFPLLIDTFVSDSDQRIITIEQAVQAADPEAIRRTAHSFKGSASNMGAAGLTEFCRQLEALGHEGRSDGADVIYQSLSLEYQAVRAALSSI